MAPNSFLMPLLIVLYVVMPASANERLVTPAEAAIEESAEIMTEDPVIFTGERSSRDRLIGDPFEMDSFEMVKAAQAPYAGNNRFLKAGRTDKLTLPLLPQNFLNALPKQNALPKPEELSAQLFQLKEKLQQQPKQTPKQMIETLTQRSPLHEFGVTVKSWFEPGVQRLEAIQNTIRTKLSDVLEKIGTGAHQAADKIR